MIQLPQEYRRYHRSHGLTKAITVGPPGYFQLWALNEVAKMNEQYNVESRAPGFVGIGDDGAGEMIAFDSQGAVFMMPIGDMGAAEPRMIASSWSEITERIKK